MGNKRNSSDRQGQHPQSIRSADVDGEHGGTEATQEIWTTKRARWNHPMTTHLIELLKEHDVPGFRTQNAWSKDAWTNIVCRLNQRFGASFSVNQVKQKEQDLKKNYRSVKDLMDESGFGWDSERMMVTAPDNVWETFAARKNNDAINWRDKSFPYFDDLFSLYDGRYAEGRTRHGMDYYASKLKNTSSAQEPNVAHTFQSPSPTLNAPGDPSLQPSLDDEVEVVDLGSSQRSTGHVRHMQAPSSCTEEVPESRRGKKQKRKSTSPEDGFHERFLQLKKEEINRFAAIEEKKMEDPYSINKCIMVVEGLQGLQLGEMLVAADIFKNKDNREVFLSFSTDVLRLAWIKREIAALDSVVL